MIDDKEEVVRYLRSVKASVESAISLVLAGKPVSEVRACYTHIRNTISDTQPHLRSIKKRQDERRRK